jgi:uncharacterized protein (DUF4415 family)
MPNTESYWIDPDDAPELTDGFFEQAKEYRGGELVQRARLEIEGGKIVLSVPFSPEVVEYFQGTGEGWQARMDAALREWISSRGAVQ